MEIEKTDQVEKRVYLTLDQHIEWCKKQSMFYVNENHYRAACALICTNLRTHPEFKEAPSFLPHMSLLPLNSIKTRQQAVDFINSVILTIT